MKHAENYRRRKREAVRRRKEVTEYSSYHIAVLMVNGFIDISLVRKQEYPIILKSPRSPEFDK